MNTSIDYNARIVCAGGIANTIAGGTLSYATISHAFMGTMTFNSTPKVLGVDLATPMTYRVLRTTLQKQM